MIDSPGLGGKLAADVKGVSELRQAAKQNSPEALKETAKQFEAIFMNMMLKSMRDATPQDGMFDSEQSRMYTSMLDQQVSQKMASRGIGLAEVLVRQLSNTVVQDGRTTSPAAGPASQGSAAGPSASRALNGLNGLNSTGQAGSSAAAPAAGTRAGGSVSAHVRDFQEKLASHAEEASRTTGIPAKFMLGQAALESGWGKREILAADGSSSHNLFGIKAGPGWKGKVVEAATTEYVNGVPHTRMEKFRAYDSYADSFRDYARMLRNNPRYENVVANAQDAAGFAQGLQKAGYATDPNYAAKLTRIITQSLSA